ncbi:MAG TPA: 2-C-methyl-D-erythritol 2,4-cyclodiphosphate synthase [Acholeplasma sp.]|nr:2-C-methyl-D-erythritol 2,4-cyclodiphosphate synthase [Acholeplasma sp.]
MYSSIVLCAGVGQRAELGYNKVTHLLNGQPIFMYSVNVFLKRSHEVIVVINKQDEAYMRGLLPSEVLITYGGEKRGDSVKAGLQLVSNPNVLIHDGARPFITEEMIEQLEDSLSTNDAAMLVKPVINTIYQKTDNKPAVLDRKTLYEAETPQAFVTDKIKMAYVKEQGVYTDDMSLFLSVYDEAVGLIYHNQDNKKITTKQDIQNLEQKGIDVVYKIGHSYDIHELVEGRKLILGGLVIPHDKGLLGHSDADVLLHAVAESIIGALGLGDLGTLYPDTDMNNKDIDSKVMVGFVVDKMKQQGYKIENLDATVFAEKPKLAPLMIEIKQSIAKLLDTDFTNINIKAATNEKLDAIGAEKAMAASATVLLRKV